jgi:hypothetical protein
MKLQRILSNSGTRMTVFDQTSYKRVSNEVLRNSRDTGALLGTPPKRAMSSLLAWRSTSALFALLPLIFVLLAIGSASQALAADITAIPTPSYASTYASGPAPVSSIFMVKEHSILGEHLKTGHSVNTSKAANGGAGSGQE